jgi:hypothetical protein
MFRFTIRDVLWLTVVVALVLSWWIDNKRIEKAVRRAEGYRLVEEMKADFEDRMAILDEAQKNAEKGSLPKPGMVKTMGERYGWPNATTAPPPSN